MNPGLVVAAQVVAFCNTDLRCILLDDAGNARSANGTARPETNPRSVSTRPCDAFVITQSPAIDASKYPGIDARSYPFSILIEA
jgi:hypothetical protein